MGPEAPDSALHAVVVCALPSGSGGPLAKNLFKSSGRARSSEIGNEVWPSRLRVERNDRKPQSRDYGV
jgi:hypothetical protein